MNIDMKQAIIKAIKTFDLPKYHQLPDMGLYLEQTVKYINHCLEPLGCMEVTGSMVRNYVKMGLVDNPVKKQYFAGHIAHLICITVLKQAANLENISSLFHYQRQVYTDQVAYDYFCLEFQNILYARFGLKNQEELIGTTQSVQKEMLRSALTAVSHIIFLNACLECLKEETPSAQSQA